MSHTHVQKVVRGFAGDLSIELGMEEFFVNGKMHDPREDCTATFEQLRAAQEETQKMRERNLLRGSRRWKIAEYKLGDNVVRALVPTKA